MVYKQWLAHSICFMFLVLLDVLKAEYTYCKMPTIHEQFSDTLPLITHVLGQDGTPCTFVDGSLPIISYQAGVINTTLFNTFQRLLDEIRIVTGYIKIHQVNSNKISLKNLQVIYGKQLTEYQGRQYSLLVETNILLKSLDLPNLAVIESGNVGFFDNGYLCQMDRQIDWRELWESPESQNFFMNQCKSRQNITIPCHSSCSSVPATCWNALPSGCQQKSKCRQRICSRCYYESDSKGEENCCDYECLGGCHGPSPWQCKGCRHVYHNETCLNSCPTGMYQLDNLCLKACPEKFLVQEGVCVETCSEEFYAENGQCIECPNGKCPHRCQLMDTDRRHLTLTSSRLKLLKNCTKLEGSLLVDGSSFVRSLPDSIKSPEEFNALENLQEISGVVMLDVKYLQTLTNLNFLRNLRRIGGIFRGTHATVQAILLVHYTGLTTGFQRLEQISSGGVTFFNCSNLKYGLTVNWPKLGATKSSAFRSDAAGEGVCSEKCDAGWGCFGPGDEMCVKCAHWQTHDYVCVSNCSLTGSYFTPDPSHLSANDSSMALLIEKRQCGQCHKECVRGCVGPGPDQCLHDECKHVRFNTTCLETCPSDTYLVDKVCQPCDSRCHKRRETRLPVCHGPGQKNCNKCAAVLFNTSSSTVEQCLSEQEHCPEGFYGQTVSPFQSIQSPVWKYISAYNEDNQPMRICRSCTPPCQLCDSHRCLHCSRAWLGDECVQNCPKERLPQKYLHNLHIQPNGTCPLCNENCRDGCLDVGPMHCFACRSYFIVDNSDKICVSQCPPDRQSIQEDGECKSYSPKQITWNPLIIGLLVILFISIGVVGFVTLIFIWCTHKRKLRYKREKKRLHELFTNGTEMLTINRQTLAYKAPNLNRLQIINADDLICNEGPTHLIGTGAFGEVYKAEWCFSTIQNYSPSLASDPLTFVTNGDTLTASHDNGNLGPFWSSALHSNHYKKKHKITVAIKMINTDLKTDSQQKLHELFEEARVMASVRHANCLPLIGICLSKGRHCLVTAYMPLGSMDKYLQSHKATLDANTLFLWSLQIADGMNYLATHGIIHRDLATRNVLLQDHHFAKITDFGLSKMLEEDDDSQIIVKTGRVPIRWLAIETLERGVYSYQTDVWAYGVTLWEIFTFGETPYKELDTLQVRDFVLRRYTLAPPSGCHGSFYEVMSKCWLPEPESRPTFRELYYKCLAFKEEADFYFTGCMKSPSIPYCYYQDTPYDRYLLNAKSSVEPASGAYTDMSRGSDMYFNSVSPEKQPFLRSLSDEEYVTSSNKWDTDPPQPVKSLDTYEDHADETVPSHVYEPIGADQLTQSDEEVESSRHATFSASDQYC